MARETTIEEKRSRSQKRHSRADECGLAIQVSSVSKATLSSRGRSRVTRSQSGMRNGVAFIAAKDRPSSDDLQKWTNNQIGRPIGWRGTRLRPSMSGERAVSLKSAHTRCPAVRRRRGLGGVLRFSCSPALRTLQRGGNQRGGSTEIMFKLCDFLAGPALKILNDGPGDVLAPNCEWWALRVSTRISN